MTDNLIMAAIAAVGAIILLVIVRAAIKELQARTAMREFLALNRFLPAEEDRTQLVEAVQALCRRSGATYEIKRPYRTSWNGKPVHYFTLSVFVRESLFGGGDAFLFPFRGGADQPFILYLKPSSVTVPAIVETVLTSLVDLSGTFRPDQMVELDLTSEMKDAGILVAYAGEAMPLDGLLDPATLKLITQSGDFGCFGFHYHEGQALITFMQNLRLPNMDLEQQWAHIRKLIEH